MLTDLLIGLCNKSPFMRRLLWRWWYGRLAKRIQAGEWTFMNYGLDDGQASPQLSPADEPDRMCIQLYDRVARPGTLESKEVLEVGAGRGGGASFVTRYHHPATMIAVDFSPQAVAYCQKRHSVNGLSFQTGDAEALPFAAGSFEAVINVESSHCYGSMQKFVQEVARVLRPGGLFLFADLRDAAEMPRLESLFAAQSDLAIVEHEDITPFVLEALKQDEQRKRAMIETLVPAKQRALFDEFAGLGGSKIMKGFEARTLLYHRFVLKRH
jgi:ubiquinone/menaquinone biosynthesis C-methylase UbiE